MRLFGQKQEFKRPLANKYRFTSNSIKNIVFAVLLMAWDAAATVFSVFIGFCIHYNFSALNVSNLSFLKQYAVLSIIIVLVSTLLCGCYLRVWHRAGIGDFCRILIACAVATAIMAVFDAVKQLPLPIEYIAVVAMLQLLLLLLIRGAIRFFYWAYLKVKIIVNRKKMKHVLVYGAGQAGQDLIRKLETHPENNLRPVCFLDDDKNLWGKNINGLKVVGGKDKLEKAIRDYDVCEVIMAITMADSEMLKEVLIKCHQNHCSLKRFGTIDDVNEKSLVNKPISDINLEDLLKRDSIHLNMNVVKGFIEGKTVLVTGGAGSIGSEICRQVLAFGAAKLIVFDFHENGLFYIQNELRSKYDSSRFVIRLGSIRDRKRVNEIFETYHPQVVFHAAAHKHVPMMELNPREAVKNNVFGTVNVAQAAILYKAEKMILISTDKAVNPTNIMGATKRIAEIVIQMFNRMSDETDFAAVRFGNVLGSSGSVVPFFKKQIAAGGPVTVTHKEMRRYFMTIPEAVQLVTEAGAMAKGGEIFVLDMGKPVYIYDLACDLIRLSGYEPDKDIKIKITGLRPGEKLFEEISLAEEDVTKTPNNKIYICKPVENDEVKISEQLKTLQSKIADNDEQGMFSIVSSLVPTFNDKKIDY